MADSSLFAPFAPFAPLLKSSNVIRHFSLETSYGLTIKINQDGSTNASLAENTPPAGTSLQRGLFRDTNFQRPSIFRRRNDRSHAFRVRRDQTGLKYTVLPEYATTCMWYTTGWPGNPEDEIDVAPDELDERYSASWCTAYNAWVYKYTRAFEEQECQLGNRAEPFPDPIDERAWLLEGMLLSCWLALQADVHTVSLDWGQGQYPIQRHDVGATLSRFVQDLPRLSDHGV